MPCNFHHNQQENKHRLWFTHVKLILQSNSRSEPAVSPNLTHCRSPIDCLNLKTQKITRCKKTGSPPKCLPKNTQCLLKWCVTTGNWFSFFSTNVVNTFLSAFEFAESFLCIVGHNMWVCLPTAMTVVHPFPKTMQFDANQVTLCQTSMLKFVMDCSALSLWNGLLRTCDEEQTLNQTTTCSLLFWLVPLWCCIWLNSNGNHLGHQPLPPMLLHKNLLRRRLWLPLGCWRKCLSSSQSALLSSPCTGLNCW